MKLLSLSLFLMFTSAVFSKHPYNIKFITGQDDSPKQSHQPYPENRVHRAGMLWMNITNCGFFGNPTFGRINYLFDDPCTNDYASPSELPGGSGINYLYYASLNFGGYINTSVAVIDNAEAYEFQGPLVSTSFEGWFGLNGIYDMPREVWPINFEEDPSGLTMGRIKEISNIEGRLNCLFEDVYDPRATAYEQFNVGFTDKLVQRGFTGMDIYDLREHIPLGIEVRQVSYAWPYDFAKKFIVIDYTIYNRNKERKDIYDFFVGVELDCDIGSKKEYYCHDDDLCGFIEKWDGYIDPATGEQKTVDMNIAWMADNDGRNYFGVYSYYEPGAGNPLDGATGVASIRVLRNPNPNLKFSFNHYCVDLINESRDWGPRWQTGLHPRPVEDHPEPLPHELRNDPRAVPWLYDLTPKQKGYDDTNYDDLVSPYNGINHFGGRTEGRPLGDPGKYMVMSNGEFDYNLTAIREVHLGMVTQADGTPIPQADKWQRYTTPETLGQHGFSQDIVDGTIKDLNKLANGTDTRFLLGFGPLGYESYVNVATDLDHDGVIDSYIPNKKVWKFAYGDSLKLTLAYIVSENFHTSLEQDPNYRDSTVVDLTDGLDASLFDQGWYDAFYNVVWAERVYDTPMYDTPVTRYGLTRGDGWYGEDVGSDAMFGNMVSDTYCWWLDAVYPGPDEGEGDFEITTFTEPVTDIYGFTSKNEDTLLPFGRQEESDDRKYGPTGNPEDGEGWGYMVKYDKLDGVFPQGTWVRYGFDDDRLTAGDGVPDFSSPPPPPSPKIKVTEIDNEITIEWTSHEFYHGDDGSVGVAGPEFTYDPFTRLYDFEGYQVYISPDRRFENFTEIFNVDKVNYSYQNVSNLYDYLDNPIPADTLAAYPDDYPALKTMHGKIYQLVPFGNNRDLSQDHSKEELYSYSCITAISPYPEWGDIRYYKFVLHNQTPGYKKYIAVTASDFGAPKMGVPAIKSSPESNAKASVVDNFTTTDEVIVVPNPYRADANYTDGAWEDLDGHYTYSEEYRKIAFLNIPERCVIRIYTLAGDLVKVIGHNGNSSPDAPYWYGKHGAHWNLINDNHQAAVSGIYLFSVQDVDNKKSDYVGKFVIIK